MDRSMPASSLRFICLLPALALVWAPAPASAQRLEEPPGTSGFALAAWPTEKAVPGDVFAIAQDPEGYLWLGTPDGVVRFDGSRFQPWTQQSSGAALPAGPVHALATSSVGGLWVGFGGGGGVAHIHQGRVVRYLPADGAPPGVNALLEDRQGTLWAATGHGLFRYQGGEWSRLTSVDGYDGEQAFSVYEDRLGRVWVGSAKGLYRRDKTSLQLIDSAATHVDGLVEDDAGNMWVTDRIAVVRKLGAARLRVGPGVRLPLPGWRVIRDQRGGLLVASFSGGLFRVVDPASASPSLQPVAYEHRLRGSPRALFLDREDNIWAGMRGGLLRLSENTFQSAGPLEGLNHEGVRTSAAAADGSVWIATNHAINRITDGGRQSYAILQTRALHSDRAGAMWVAGEDLLGRYVGGRFVAEAIPGAKESRVTAMATTPDRLWLCTAFRGVLSWAGGTLTSHRQPGESARQCTTIIADRHDRVWAGFTSGGVALHEHGSVRALTERDGLAPGSVQQILEGRDGALWFATSGGVSRFQDGRFTSVTSATAPTSGVVPVLVEDEQGYIWLGVRSGAALMRFHAREMDRVAEQRDYRIAYTLYDDTDGLQPQLWQRGVGGVRDAAGRLWVVNGLGMTIIDPRHLREPRRPSPPRLDAVTVDGERIAPGAVRELPNGATVQMDYAVLSLSAASKLRFRHLLEGVDAGWVYNGESRQASYSQLPAGNYRFRVSATHDGQWSDAAVWAFSIAPPFYLSRWFLIIAGAVPAVAIAVGTWLRVRSVKTRYALVLAERTRLSREIHDTLLQSLAALGPELEVLATRATPANAELAGELRRVRRQVGRSVREARDSILELRRHPLRTPRLADSLAELAETTAERSGLRPTVVVEGRRPGHASSEIDMQLFRIAQEAVNNAIRHGHATRIDIHVSYTGGQVALTVTDNGCGFTPEDEAVGRGAEEHFGLITMRERAEKAGGRLRIEGAPGRGTTVHAVAEVTSTWL
jgi:signal transduction histidine kinase/ligand-binding sensor domain-containing protein